MEACPVVLDCQVERIIEEDADLAISSLLKFERLADPELLDDKDILKMTAGADFYFMGTATMFIVIWIDRAYPMGSSLSRKRGRRMTR